MQKRLSPFVFKGYTYFEGRGRAQYEIHSYIKLQKNAKEAYFKSDLFVQLYRHIIGGIIQLQVESYRLVQSSPKQKQNH